jgi:hypothetical protein
MLISTRCRLAVINALRPGGPAHSRVPLYQFLANARMAASRTPFTFVFAICGANTLAVSSGRFAGRAGHEPRAYMYATDC